MLFERDEEVLSTLNGCSKGNTTELRRIADSRQIFKWLIAVLFGICRYYYKLFKLSVFLLHSNMKDGESVKGEVYHSDWNWIQDPLSSIGKNSRTHSAKRRLTLCYDDRWWHGAIALHGFLFSEVWCPCVAFSDLPSGVGRRKGTWMVLSAGSFFREMVVLYCVLEQLHVLL